MRRKSRTFLVCPNCGSREIEIASLTGAGMVGLGLPEKYYCHNCGYLGLPLEVTESQYKKLKFTPKKIRKPRMTKTLKEAQEFVRVVLVLTVLAFFAFSVFLFMPGQESTYYPPQKITGEPAKQPQFTWQAFATPDTEEQDVSRATGLASVQAFLLPMFLLFFTLGMLAMGIYSHWHRMRLFG